MHGQNKLLRKHGLRATASLGTVFPLDRGCGEDQAIIEDGSNTVRHEFLGAMRLTCFLHTLIGACEISVPGGMKAFVWGK